MDKAEESALTEGGEVTILLTQLQQTLQVPPPPSLPAAISRALAWQHIVGRCPCPRFSVIIYKSVLLARILPAGWSGAHVRRPAAGRGQVERVRPHLGTRRHGLPLLGLVPPVPRRGAPRHFFGTQPNVCVWCVRCVRCVPSSQMNSSSCICVDCFKHGDVRSSVSRLIDWCSSS